MPIYIYKCDECHEQFESLMKPYDPVSCSKCGCNNATKQITACSYKWNCDPGGSTNPKTRANQESARREGKRERVTKMIEKGACE